MKPIFIEIFFSKIAYTNSAIKGCILSTLCPVVNTVYFENGINKYCCNTDLCNNQSVIVAQTTTQAPLTTVMQSAITCRFGSLGGNTQSIQCPNNTTQKYYCSVIDFAKLN